MPSTKVSFANYGKTFQEKLCYLVLDDRVFSDRMQEVLDVEFLEFKYLQTFVEKSFLTSGNMVHIHQLKQLKQF